MGIHAEPEGHDYCSLPSAVSGQADLACRNRESVEGRSCQPPSDPFARSASPALEAGLFAFG